MELVRILLRHLLNQFRLGSLHNYFVVGCPVATCCTITANTIRRTDAERLLQHLLTFLAALLDIFQVTGIVIQLILTRTATTAIAASTTIATLISIRIDMLTRLCKTAFQVLQFLLLGLTLGILRIDAVQLMLLIPSLSTVKLFLLAAEGTDGGIGTVLTEPSAHLRHLIRHLTVPGIRKGHIDIVCNNALLGILILTKEVADGISEEYQRQEDDQRQDILRLFEINLFHAYLFSKFSTIISSCLCLISICRESSCVLSGILMSESSWRLSRWPSKAILSSQAV